MIAVRPPEYWPRPVYFAVVDAAERFVLADESQYSRQSFQNRARLRTPQGTQWISVPLRGSRYGRPIRDVEIHGKAHWIRSHWRALAHNYRSSPFFDFFEPELRRVFERDWARLGDLTCATVECLVDLLEIRTPLIRASSIAGGPTSVTEILAAVGVNVLLSPAESANVDQRHAPVLRVLHFEETAYRQNFAGFEPATSVLDLLFNYGREALPMIRRASTICSPVESAG